MRPIKFRAWKDNKMYYSNDYPDLSCFFCLAYGQIGDVLSELMQFTGLKDSNEKEIFEGDVVYLSGYGRYQVEFPFIQLYESGYEGDIGEILGNIYETPELLK